MQSVAEGKTGTAIERTIKAYEDRLNASDPRGVVDLYTSDGVLMRQGVETVVGTQQLKAEYERGFAAVQLARAFHVDEILVDGDLASVRTMSTGTMTIRATGEVLANECRELLGLRRVGGEWKIAHYMFQEMPAK